MRNLMFHIIAPLQEHCSTGTESSTLGLM